MTREEWLRRACDAVEPLFTEIDLPLPDVYVSAGWPSRSARPGKNQRIGECWPAGGEDGVPHIFISPMVDDSYEILGILVHELIHAAVGPGVGHRAGFGRPARRLGLAGPLTATQPGPELRGRLNEIAEALGNYPHTALVMTENEEKKQTTRMLKVEASCCGYIVRTTQKWIDFGLPSCPCGNEMEVPE